MGVKTHRPVIPASITQRTELIPSMLSSAATKIVWKPDLGILAGLNGD